MKTKANYWVYDAGSSEIVAYFDTKKLAKAYIAKLRHDPKECCEWKSDSEFLSYYCIGERPVFSSIEQMREHFKDPKLGNYPEIKTRDFKEDL